MRFFKYLVFVVLSIVSVNSYSDWYFFNEGTSKTYKTGQEACDTKYYQSTGITFFQNSTTTGHCRNSSGTPIHYSDLKYIQSCPSSVTTKPISVPGWTDWDIDQIEDYHKKILPTICYQGCRYKDPSMNGSEGSDLLSLSYSSPEKDSSCPAGSTQPNTPSPDGPSNPTDPTNPPPDEQECKNANGSDAYCPKPPNGCPTGYTEQSFNGEQICVKNSPEDPNPNDPNNNDNQPPASEPTGGDGNGVDLTPVINAINSLKAALTSAINSLKESLTAGFKTVTDAIGLTNSKLDATNTKLDKSNEHLDNIKKESIKGNEKLDKVNENLTGTNSKLDKANDYLKDISDASSAASEAIAETNKKLDGIKDSVDAFGKCKNESYNPNDPHSKKYRECTEEDAKNGLGGEVSTPFKDLDLGAINTDLFKANAQCPAPIPLYIPVVKHTFHIDLSALCQVLEIMGYVVAIFAMVHGIAILVENS